MGDEAVQFIQPVVNFLQSPEAPFIIAAVAVVAIASLGILRWRKLKSKSNVVSDTTVVYSTRGLKQRRDIRLP